MSGTRPLRLSAALLAGALALAGAATGQDAAAGAGQEAAAESPAIGPVTHLPLPRFVSLKASEGNVRRGPSLKHRIDWVFKRRGMPLEIIGEYGNWRRVRDQDGVGGWMHYSLLSGARTGLVVTDLAPLYVGPDTRTPLKARLEAGVIVRLEKCLADWCRARVEGVKGWMVKSDLWGVRPDESFD